MADKKSISFQSTLLRKIRITFARPRTVRLLKILCMPFRSVSSSIPWPAILFGLQDLKKTTRKVSLCMTCFFALLNVLCVEYSDASVFVCHMAMLWWLYLFPMNLIYTRKKNRSVRVNDKRGDTAEKDAGVLRGGLASYLVALSDFPFAR